MIQPKEAHELANRGQAVIVDVREEHELRETGQVAGSWWLPTSKMHADEPEWKGFLARLPKEKKIAVYCRSGQRSGRVSEYLKLEGFDAVNLGGFKDWQAAGLPTQAFTGKSS